MVLMTIAPRSSKSTALSSPSAKVPEAGMTGLASATPPISTRMSTKRSPPEGRTPARPSIPDGGDPAVDAEFAHTAEAHAEPAGHLLLQRHLAGNPEFAPEPLQQQQQAVGAAGEKRIRPVIGDRAAENAFQTGRTAGPLGIGDLDDSAPIASKRSADIITAGERALSTAVTPIPFAAASSASGASVASPTPRPTTTIRRQPGARVKPTPSGPNRSRRSPGASVASALVPLPVTL